MGGVSSAKKGRANINIQIQAPSWIPVEWLDIYVNGKKQPRIPIQSTETLRYNKTHTIQCQSDCFVVAMAGSDKTLAPIVSNWRKRQPEPIAMTNPIFIDVDGDGEYMAGAPK